MFCSDCGTRNEDEAKFCGQCGALLGETLKEGSPSGAKSSRDESFHDKNTGFFSALFDFSFTQFVTSKTIRLLYGLSILLASLLAVFLIIAGFSTHWGIGTLALFIIAPLAFLITVIYGRVFLEIIIVIFRIAEHTAHIAKTTASGK
jgi:hypothetical protein